MRVLLNNVFMFQNGNIIEKSEKKYEEEKSFFGHSCTSVHTACCNDDCARNVRGRAQFNSVRTGRSL